jgi:hypothetical protein
MQIFDFTDGVKGNLLGNCKLMNSSEGWLVRKDDRVYRVEMANMPEGWSWTGGATWLQWNEDGSNADVPILPSDYGVEAICFCWGQTRHDKVWNWYVVGTTDWNRGACKTGILKYTFTHEWGPECSGHPDFVEPEDQRYG